MEIAPLVQARCDSWTVPLVTAEDRLATAQLRALLAVARAARIAWADWPGKDNDAKLGRALARLERVSRRPGGSP